MNEKEPSDAAEDQDGDPQHSPSEDNTATDATGDRPPGSLVLVVVVGTIAALFAVWGVLQVGGVDRSPGQRFTAAAIATILLGIVIVSWFAWKAGGYRQLMSAGGRRLVSVEARSFLTKAQRSTLNLVRGTGGFLLGLSGFAAGALVLMTLGGAPNDVERTTAIAIVVTFVLGQILRSLGWKKRGRLTARADSLGAMLNSLSKATEGTRSSLISTASALHEFENEAKAEFTRLEKERTEVQKLAEALKVDPALVASLRDQLRKESSKTVWLTVAVTVLSILATIVVAISTPELTEIWGRFTDWFQSL